MDINQYDLIASITRESFFDFVTEFWQTVISEKFSYNWHIQLICDEVQVILERVFKHQASPYDLVVNVPPGTTKSTIISVMLLPWAWTRMPSFKYICASHSSDLGINLSRLSRDVINSPLYQKCFPHVQLRADSKAKGTFINTHGGARRFATVGGKSPTGFHAHLIGVDDPLDPRKAISAKEIENANNFMTETLPSRKVNKLVTPTILVMQRLHQNDPSGAMLARGGNRHICLPAELTDDVSPTPLRSRYVDGLLDPKRLSAEALAKFKLQSNYAYSSQFLQSAIPRGGGSFKTDRIHIVDVAPTYAERVRYWDKAGTSNGGCFTVGIKMAKEPNGKVYIENIVRGQWDSDERERIIVQTANTDGKAVIIGVEQEPGSGGLESAQATTRRLAGYRFFLERPSGDKEWRADPYSAYVNAGNVSLVQGDWNAAYLDELRYYPRSRYKDQVDASSGAFNRLFKRIAVIGGLSVHHT